MHREVARGVRVDHVGDVAIHEEIRHNIDKTGCIVRGTSMGASKNDDVDRSRAGVQAKVKTVGEETVQRPKEA